MICQCGSERIIGFKGDVADRFILWPENNQLVEWDGYPPCNQGCFISDDGDTIEMRVCLDCGKVQSEFPFPVPQETVDSWFGEDDED